MSVSVSECRVSQWNPPPGWRTNINRKFAAAQKKEKAVVKEYNASAAKKEEQDILQKRQEIDVLQNQVHFKFAAAQEKEVHKFAAAQKDEEEKEEEYKAAATGGGGHSAQLSIADQKLALSHDIDAPLKQVQSLSDDSDECKECCAEEVPKKKDCPCCQPKEVLIEFRIPMTCTSFTPEAQEIFKCAIAEQVGNDDCSTVTIPALECPAEEPRPEKEKCDCCNDHARRRLLWAGFECPCCKTKGHAAWSAGRRLLQAFDYTHDPIKAEKQEVKVDAAIKTTAGKAGTVAELLSSPANLNKALKSFGLPKAEILEAPTVLDEAPPMRGNWPHHDYLSWKDSKRDNAWIGDWEHRGDQAADQGGAKLQRLGINVNDESGILRAMPVPQFDETQWDHYATHKSKQITWENGHAFHDIEARDSGHAVLQKAGVNIGDYGRTEISDKKLVHTLFGIQTRTSYFSDDNEIYQPPADPDKDAKVRAKLAMAGLNVDGLPSVAGPKAGSHTYMPNRIFPKTKSRPTVLARKTYTTNGAKELNTVYV